MDVRLWLLFCDFSEDDFDFLEHKITNPEYAPPQFIMCIQYNMEHTYPHSIAVKHKGISTLK